MAQFIQKFADRRDYEASEHQYPNVSLIEDEGLVYTMEQPEPDVLLNGSKIKWNVTDGVDRTSVDYPSISFADAQTLINALNDDRNYTVTATINFNYQDKTVLENAECWLEAVETNEITAYFSTDKGDFTICNINLFSNTKAPVYNAVEIDVAGATYQTATWEINYTIENAR